MKQLALTVLIILGAILTGSSAGAQNGFDVFLPLVVTPPDNFVCERAGDGAELCAWVSDGTPSQGQTVVVYGRLIVNGVAVVGEGMASEWRYRTTTARCDTGVTGADGVASCGRGIGNASLGFEVEVVVSIGGYEAVTRFTPTD